MTVENRKKQRINIRKKAVIEKRGIKFACHLKDLSVDAQGLSFVSSAVFALHEHLIFDINDLVDSTFHGVECVVRVVHISQWEGRFFYGCEVAYRNPQFDKLVESLERQRSGGSRLRFLSNHPV